MNAMAPFGFGNKKQGASLKRRKAAAQRAHVDAPAIDVSATVVQKKRKAKTARKPLPWRALGLQSMPVLAVMLVLGLLIGGWQLLDHVGSVPVSRVAVTGTLRHTDRNLLIERVRPYLHEKGFMTVDLAAIRADLLQLPWVAEVAIQRRWPDQLVIDVIEQEAIARWGKDGLLNRRGEVFRPGSLGDVAELPLLYGPDNLSADVVARYAQMRELLSEHKLQLSDLGSDERGSWSATLQGGVVLRLGTGDILKKMRSFSQVYRAELSGQMGRIAYIDLRYGNGLAVGWKAAGTQAATNEKDTINSGVSGHG